MFRSRAHTLRRAGLLGSLLL